MTQEQYEQVKRFGQLAGDVFPEGGYDVHRNEDGSYLLSLMLEEQTVRGTFPELTSTISNEDVKVTLRKWRKQLVGHNILSDES